MDGWPRWIAIGVGLWCALSLPISLLVGRWLARINRGIERLHGRGDE